MSHKVAAWADTTPLKLQGDDESPTWANWEASLLESTSLMLVLTRSSGKLLNSLSAPKSLMPSLQSVRCLYADWMEAEAGARKSVPYIVDVTLSWYLGDSIVASVRLLACNISI